MVRTGWRELGAGRENFKRETEHLIRFDFEIGRSWVKSNNVLENTCKVITNHKGAEKCKQSTGFFGRSASVFCAVSAHRARAGSAALLLVGAPILVRHVQATVVVCALV